MGPLALLLTSMALAFPVANATEEATLAAGRPAIRTLPTDNAAAVSVIGWVDARATADQVWKVLLDFPGRKATNPQMTEIRAYRPAAGADQWWAFTVTKFGMSVVYHNHYYLDRAANRLKHDLDTTQTNDLRANTGVYEVGACTTTAAPCTRLAWSVETDFGRALPSMIRTWLGRAAVEGFLLDVAARAPRY